MSILTNIQRIKLFASCLFFIPLVALFLSLFLNNHLVMYDSAHFPLNEIKFGKFECNKINNFCNNEWLVNDDGSLTRRGIRTIKFINCSKFDVSWGFYTLTSRIIRLHTDDKEERKKFENDEALFNAMKEEIPFFVVIRENKNRINKGCIKNSILYKFYKLIPVAGDIFVNTRHKATLGISKPVFPFIDGEASISNIVRHYPFSLIFKPLMFITSIIMIFYWINYYSLLKKILPFRKSTNSFALFGILSAIFLFLHVLLLGIDNQTDLIKQSRKIIIVSFILFEILAEFYLAKKLYNCRNILQQYMYKKIILAKIIFVSIIVFATSIILFLITIKDMSSNFNNIVEWNYFTFLLVFYLLSTIAWKKDKSSVTHR